MMEEKADVGSDPDDREGVVNADYPLFLEKTRKKARNAEKNFKKGVAFRDKECYNAIVRSMEVRREAQAPLFFDGQL